MLTSSLPSQTIGFLRCAKAKVSYFTPSDFAWGVATENPTAVPDTFSLCSTSATYISLSISLSFCSMTSAIFLITSSALSASKSNITKALSISFSVKTVPPFLKLPLSCVFILYCYKFFFNFSKKRKLH